MRRHAGGTTWGGRRCGAVLVVVALATHATPTSAQVESLPPDHWAYEQLERFEARGHIVLPGVRPWTRARVGGWVRTLRDAVDSGAAFSPVELQRLERLENEFVDGERIAESKRRFDPPLVRILDESWNFAGDADLHTGGAGAFGAQAGPQAGGTAWGRGNFEALLRFRDWMAYETRYRVTLEEQADVRVDENRISSRERNWNGLTSHHDRAYVAVDGGRARFVLGRDYIGWGAARGDELLISDAGLSLDAVQFHLRLSRFQLSSATALLSAADNRHYAAHRLEVDLGGLWVGLQESVVYVSPHFEPTYLFPLSFYYGNQFNERENDNTLLGLDLKWSSPVGVFDGELLVDDFIYDGDPAPNKLGYRAGWRRGFVVAGMDAGLRVSYTRLNRWTFTHRVPGNAYVAGAGDATTGDSFLGHPLGPDADRWRAAASWSPNVDWTAELSWTHTRRGDGNRDLSAWESTVPYDPAFPSGVVQSVDRLGLETRTWFTRNVSLRGTGELGWTPTGREFLFGGELRLDL